MYAALIITVREGLEAALLVGVVLAVLKRQGDHRQRVMVWLGVGVAAAASALLGTLLVVTVGGLSGAGREIAEGLLECTAAAILTYVLWWMGRQSRALSRSLSAGTSTALGTGSGVALLGLVVITIFREGAETALYLGAAAAGGSPTAVARGAGIGLAAGVLAGWVIYRGGTGLLNLHVFFQVTTLILFAFGVGLVGHATLAMQAAHVLPGTISVWDSSGLLRDDSAVGASLSALVGYTAQPSVLQLIFMGGYVALVLSLHWQPDPTGLARITRSYRQLPYRLMRDRRFTRYLSLTMGATLAVIIIVGLFDVDVGPFDNQGWVRLGPLSAEGDQNNLFEFVMWIVWLPLLSLGTLVFGRLWCGNLCPLRLFTDWTRSLARKLGFGRGQVSRRTFRLGWLLPASFIAVTFVVKGGPVQNQARLGAIFFLSMFLIAGIVGLLFRQGTWCRYLCPIGGWLARITRLSPLALRPQADICATCTDKPCVTGTTLAGRCPMALNPSRLATSRDCITCWNCVTNCPPQRASLKLGLRVPGAELVTPTRPSFWESLFVASLIGMYMSVGQKSPLLADLDWPVLFFGLVTAATGAYLLACALAAPLAGVSWRHAVGNFGYALLPLEFGTAIIAMGDDALEFLNIVQPAAVTLLAIGFAWSVYLTATIIGNHARTRARAITAAIPIGALLVAVLVIWLHWYATGTVTDIS